MVWRLRRLHLNGTGASPAGGRHPRPGARLPDPLEQLAASTGDPGDEELQRLAREFARMHEGQDVPDEPRMLWRTRPVLVITFIVFVLLIAAGFIAALLFGGHHICQVPVHGPRRDMIFARCKHR